MLLCIIDAERYNMNITKPMRDTSVMFSIFNSDFYDTKLARVIRFDIGLRVRTRAISHVHFESVHCCILYTIRYTRWYAAVTMRSVYLLLFIRRGQKA